MACPSSPSLTMKGFRPGFSNPAVWDRRPDRWSPSCGLVLQSMVPALVLKTILFALSSDHQLLNIGGVVTPKFVKGYKWECWFMPLSCGLQAERGHLCVYPALKSWVANGEAIALHLGGGGGGHFAKCTEKFSAKTNCTNLLWICKVDVCVTSVEPLLVALGIVCLGKAGFAKDIIPN